MEEYCKINTIWKRDNWGKILVGQYSTPEIEFLADNEWCFTEKVDGTNIRIMWDGETVRFGGRTDAAQIPATLVAVLQSKFPAEKMRMNFNGPACLYGEGYGAKIQAGGGNYKSDGQDFVLFDVKVGPWWLNRDDVFAAGANLGISVVPVVGRGTLGTMAEVVSQGLGSSWGNFKAEGIVARPSVAMFSRRGERIIAKLKTKDFKQNKNIAVATAENRI